MQSPSFRLRWYFHRLCAPNHCHIVLGKALGWVRRLSQTNNNINNGNRQTQTRTHFRWKECNDIPASTTSGDCNSKISSVSGKVHRPQWTTRVPATDELRNPRSQGLREHHQIAQTTWFLRERLSNCRATFFPLFLFLLGSFGRLWLINNKCLSSLNAHTLAIANPWKKSLQKISSKQLQMCSSSSCAMWSSSMEVEKKRSSHSLEV